jgi:hypothetical protein
MAKDFISPKDFAYVNEQENGALALFLHKNIMSNIVILQIVMSLSCKVLSCFHLPVPCHLAVSYILILKLNWTIKCVFIPVLHICLCSCPVYAVICKNTV